MSGSFLRKQAATVLKQASQDAPVSASQSGPGVEIGHLSFKIDGATEEKFSADREKVQKRMEELLNSKV